MKKRSLTRQDEKGHKQRDISNDGSVDFEYGSRKKGQKYLDLEIYEKDRRVAVYSKDETGESSHEEIEMEDINVRVQQF